MIIKRIDAGAIASKAGYVIRLARYMIQPWSSRRQERVLYSGFRGFISEDYSGAQVEMAAMAAGASGSANPSLHLVISWKEGEQPTPADIEEAVTVLMRELQLSGHGVLYVLHQDTDNIHCHVAICRVHPVTERVIVAARGFDLEAIHRAIARIEHAQGWEREPNPRYDMLGDGRLVRQGNAETAGKRPDQRRVDMERRTGEKSAQRRAIEQAAHRIAGAHTWGALHESLAAIGMRYERTGSGAVIFVEDVPIKASSVHRNASLTRLQRRLGDYVPAVVTTEQDAGCTQGPAPEPLELKPDAPGWRSYIQARRAFFAARKHARAHLKDQQDGDRKALLEQQRAERALVLGGHWDGAGMARAALRSVLAAEHASHKAKLRAEHLARRDAVRKQFPAFPDYEAWLRAQELDEDADAWRYQLTHWSCFRRTAVEKVLEDDDPQPQDIRAYTAHPVGRTVHYCKSLYDGSIQKADFIDSGNEIHVCDPHDDAAILAAMQLASQKWGGRFEIDGSDNFKARCVALAAQHNVALKDPVLAEAVKAQRTQIQEALRQAEHWPPVHAWAPYAVAMGTSRYRVTMKHVFANGESQLERLGTVTGGRSGLNFSEVLQSKQKMAEAREQEYLGERVLVSPVMDDKAVLRISGVSGRALQQMKADGVAARVVFEVGPGEYEALVTVPRQGLVQVDQASAAWGEKMAQRYGTKVELCGADSLGHPAPGMRGLGKFGFNVEVQAATGQDCALTYKAIQDLDAELQTRHLDMTVQPVVEADLVSPKDWTQNQMAAAAHHGQLTREFFGKSVHPSRVDAQIALRMRATGHDRQEVVDALMHRCQHRSDQQGNTEDARQYAQRAAAFAWGVAGQRQLERQATLVDVWSELEFTRAGLPNISSRKPGVR